jgi:hypothetical protein
MMSEPFQVAKAAAFAKLVQVIADNCRRRSGRTEEIDVAVRHSLELKFQRPQCSSINAHS